MDGGLGYLVVILLGAIVGMTEIASRYRDHPFRSLAGVAAGSYVAVNAAGSAFALLAIRAFEWNFGIEDGSGLDLARVLIAGVGALALFRTRLFSAAYKGESHAFGPGQLLEQLLTVADRQVDRSQAARRSKTAAEVMAEVSFRKAYGILPTYALGLLESPSKEDQERLASDVKGLVSDATMDDRAKAQALGVAVMRFIGPDLLRQAVAALGPSIQRSASRRSTRSAGGE